MLDSGNNPGQILQAASSVWQTLEPKNQSHKKYQGGEDYSPHKRQEKAGSRAERRLDLPQDILFVTHSMDSVEPLAPEEQEQWHRHRTDTAEVSWFITRLSQAVDVVFCVVWGRVLLGFTAKKAQIEAQMVQWKSLSMMVVAGPNSARYRFPCVTAHTASVLTQRKQGRIWDKPQPQPNHCAARAPSADVTGAGQPSRTTASGHAQGKEKRLRARSLQRLLSNMHNTKLNSNKGGQTSQWIFLPWHTLPAPLAWRRQSLQQTGSSQSNTWDPVLGCRGWLMGCSPAQPCSSEGFFPLVHAPEYSVEEWEMTDDSLLSVLVSGLAFFSLEHQ